MAPLRIAVLASGSGSNLQAVLDACEEDRIDGDVVVVASDHRDAKALTRAKRHGAAAVFVDPADRTRREHDAEVGDALEDHGADLVVLAGYLRILSDAFVDRFRWKLINIHPALLPLFGGEGYYGARVHEAALEAGVRFTGATTHFVTEEVDQGPIILQAAVPIYRDDTPHSLQQRVLGLEHEILPRTIDLYAQDRLRVVDEERVEILPGDDAWEPDKADVLYTDGF